MRLHWFQLFFLFYEPDRPVDFLDQRTYALRLGGHVMSRHFRYYVPEFSGRIVVQTQINVR